MEAEGENILLEENYYQLLNVSKTASVEEINSAYRRFSRIFHPDKHGSDPTRQKWADQIFNKIKQAYEVLSDPHRRAIYDTLGKRGLEVDGWEVIVRTQTPREIREEYERLKREREERRLQQSTNPRGTITMSINATDLFMKYYDEYEILEESTLFPNIEVSGMNIQQSVDAPVTLTDTVRLSGNISTQNGIGSGSVNISNRRVTSEKGWAELELGIGNGPSLGLKMFRTVSRVMFLSGGTVLQFTPRGITPSLLSTLALQLDAQSVGYVSYRAGTSASSLTTSYVRDTQHRHGSVALQLGNPHSFLSVSFMSKLPERQMKLRFALKVGTFGVVAEYGAEKKVSQHSNVSAAVMLGVPTGVMLKLKWTRASQTLVVPIHLCEELIPAPVFYATVLPVVAWLTINRLFLEPIARGREERERQRSREANFDRIQEMQREARATVELMKETYSRIRSDEDKKKGLVILRAIYGKLPPSTLQRARHAGGECGRHERGGCGGGGGGRGGRRGRGAAAHRRDRRHRAAAVPRQGLQGGATGGEQVPTGRLLRPVHWRGEAPHRQLPIPQPTPRVHRCRHGGGPPAQTGASSEDEVLRARVPPPEAEAAAPRHRPRPAHTRHEHIFLVAWAGNRCICRLRRQHQISDLRRR